ADPAPRLVRDVEPVGAVTAPAAHRDRVGRGEEAREHVRVIVAVSHERHLLPCRAHDRPIVPRRRRFFTPVFTPQGQSASAGVKVRATEFMQKRSPDGVWGASSDTCARCEPQLAQRTSVSTMPWLRSSSCPSAYSARGEKKLGHPQCTLNLDSLRKSSAPHARHAYVPGRSSPSRAQVQGRSVAATRSTANSTGFSSSAHSSSDFVTR